MMRRIGLIALALLVCSSTWAISSGTGGRIYLTRTWYQGLADCTTELLRVDVDANWGVTTNYGTIAEVVNRYSVNTNHYRVTSPEILHARSYDDGTPRAGDGSLFMAGFTDNADHTAYSKVTPTGTVSLIHPGTGRSVSGGGPRTAPYSAMLVDRDGGLSGRADTMMHWSGGYSSGAWYDMNGNDDLTDDPPAQAWAYPGYSRGGGNDAESGGTPTGDCATFAQYGHYAWSNTYLYIYHTPYTGTADCHTWGAVTTFYNYGQFPAGSGKRFRMDDSGIAVGDTDGDGNEDVYFLTTSVTGYDVVSPSIIRMSDHDGTGTIDCASTTDYVKIIYDCNTLAGASNNLVDQADMELLRNPLTQTWFLLILERGSAYAARDGRLLVVELSDNGDFAGGDAAFKVILTGLETGTGQNATGLTYWGIEFDADPAAIPEPATLLLVGSGALGAFGWARRRRVR